jgi:hypothetical protein
MSLKPIFAWTDRGRVSLEAAAVAGGELFRILLEERRRAAFQGVYD